MTAHGLHAPHLAFLAAAHGLHAAHLAFFAAAHGLQGVHDARRRLTANGFISSRTFEPWQGLSFFFFFFLALHGLQAEQGAHVVRKRFTANGLPSALLADASSARFAARGLQAPAMAVPAARPSATGKIAAVDNRLFLKLIFFSPGGQ